MYLCIFYDGVIQRCGDEVHFRVPIGLLLGSGSQRQRDGVEGPGDHSQCTDGSRFAGHQPPTCLRGHLCNERPNDRILSCWDKLMYV